MGGPDSASSADAAVVVLNSDGDFSHRNAEVIAQGQEFASDFLEHFGVKGMKWGVRSSRGGTSASSRPPISEDAKTAQASKDKQKAGGTKALSTKELQDLVLRMNLEQQFSNLKGKENSKVSDGQARVKQLLSVGKTLQDAHNFAKSPTGKLIATTLTTAAFTAARAAGNAHRAGSVIGAVAKVVA